MKGARQKTDVTENGKPILSRTEFRVIDFIES
jgi:hypothetical protein